MHFEDDERYADRRSAASVPSKLRSDYSAGYDIRGMMRSRMMARVAHL